MQPKSLSPNGAILGDMIRQGEEVRVREKCGGFMLVVEGVCITHRPFKGMCPAWAIPSRNCRKSASGALLCGRGQREFEGPSDPIFTGSFFFSWMLHGSTKVVVRAVALLSANTRINRMSLSKVVYVVESNN